MKKPWLPEYSFDVEQATFLIEKEFPDFQEINIRFVGEGWHNKAFLVNDKYIFRFPKQKSVACQ